MLSHDQNTAFIGCSGGKRKTGGSGGFAIDLVSGAINWNMDFDQGAAIVAGAAAADKSAVFFWSKSSETSIVKQSRLFSLDPATGSGAEYFLCDVPLINQI